MDKGNGDEILENLMKILEDGDWHTVEDIADKLSLSMESASDILEKLEKAGIIQSTNPRKKTGLIKGTSFIDTFFELPSPEESSFSENIGN